MGGLWWCLLARVARRGWVQDEEDLSALLCLLSYGAPGQVCSTGRGQEKRERPAGFDSVSLGTFGILALP